MINEEIAAFIASELSLQDPDPNKILINISDNFGLSSLESQQLLYLVVLQLNQKLFPAITGLELFHTNGCNLRCSYCFEKRILHRKNISEQIAKAAVDLLFDYCGDEKELRILHFGGEPMLNFDSIVFVTNYANEKGKLKDKTVNFSMTTNGTLLNEETASFLAENSVTTLISLDGMQDVNDRYRIDAHGEGTFLRVMEGIKLLKRFQPWIGIKMTIHPLNVERMFEDIVSLHDLGVNQFVIGPATGICWTEDKIDIFEMQIRNIYSWYNEKPRSELRIQEFEKEIYSHIVGCQAGRHSITVTVDGHIVPCAKMVGLEKSKLIYPLGDVYCGIYQLLNRRELIRCNPLRKRLIEAGIHEYSGGCFATNYENNGDIFSPHDNDQKFTSIFKKIIQSKSLLAPAS